MEKPSIENKEDGIEEEIVDPDIDADTGFIDVYGENSEEIAGELTADDMLESMKDNEKPTSMQTEVISMYGWIGLALAVISFFMMPVFLGAVAIILGFVSRSKGAHTLGNIAIAGGVLSIIVNIFI